MGFYKYYYYVCKKGGNMKRILSLLSILLALSAYAEHEYIPYVEEGKVWVSFDVSSSSYKQVGIGELTEINNKLYHKLYISILDAITNEITYAGLHGYIREENKKVFTRELNNEFETMIYDFDIQAGDTIQFQQGETIVDSIETQIYYGKERHVFYVTHESSQINDIWIEGVGSQEFPIMLSLIPNFGASGMMFYEYSYNYNTEEIFPTDKTPKPEFSYPEHEYISFLQEGNAWVQESIDSGYGRNMITDTVTIDGKEYCVLSFRALDIYESIIWDSHYKTYLREEGKKVYRYHYDESFVPTWNNTEHLFFDFGAQAGDSIVVADWEEYKQTLVIDSVCQKVLDNKERDVFYVSYMKLYKEREETYIENHDVWIEGIGPTQTATFDEMVCKWGLACGASLFYCYHNYNTGYTYPEDKTMIDFSAVHATPADGCSLTLHREGDALMAVFPVASAGEAITLYDTTGRAVATQAIRQGATTATIDITALPAGVYIARLNSGATAKVVW